MRIVLPLAVASGLLLSGSAAAENLNFNFRNPNFGGNPVPSRSVWVEGAIAA